MNLRFEVLLHSLAVCLFPWLCKIVRLTFRTTVPSDSAWLGNAISECQALSLCNVFTVIHRQDRRNILVSLKKEKWYRQTRILFDRTSSSWHGHDTVKMRFLLFLHLKFLQKRTSRLLILWSKTLLCFSSTKTRFITDFQLNFFFTSCYQQQYQNLFFESSRFLFACQVLCLAKKNDVKTAAPKRQKY